MPMQTDKRSLTRSPTATTTRVVTSVCVSIGTRRSLRHGTKEGVYYYLGQCWRARAPRVPIRDHRNTLENKGMPCDDQRPWVMPKKRPNNRDQYKTIKRICVNLHLVKREAPQTHKHSAVVNGWVLSTGTPAAVHPLQTHISASPASTSIFLFRMWVCVFLCVCVECSGFGLWAKVKWAGRIATSLPLCQNEYRKMGSARACSVTVVCVCCFIRYPHHIQCVSIPQSTHKNVLCIYENKSWMNCGGWVGHL